MAVLIIGGQKAGEHTWNDCLIFLHYSSFHLSNDFITIMTFIIVLNSDDVIDELASGAYGRILLMRLKKTGELFIIKRLPYVNANKKKMA
jgi:hypothetical protein